jgi:hypothetical protein
VGPLSATSAAKSARRRRTRRVGPASPPVGSSLTFWAPCRRTCPRWITNDDTGTFPAGPNYNIGSSSAWDMASAPVEGKASKSTGVHLAVDDPFTRRLGVHGHSKDNAWCGPSKLSDPGPTRWVRDNYYYTSILVTVSLPASAARKYNIRHLGPQFTTLNSPIPNWRSDTSRRPSNDEG